MKQSDQNLQKAGVVCVFLTGLYLFIHWYWEATAPSIFLWGDSYANAQRVYPILANLESLGPWSTLNHPHTFNAGLRVPGLYLAASAFLHTFGTNHRTLMFFQSLIIAFGGIGIYWAVYLSWGRILPAVVAFFMLLTGPEAISQAHNFMLEAPSMAGGAWALLGLSLAQKNSRWDGAILCFGLSLGFFSRQNFAASTILPILIVLSPMILQQMRQSPWATFCSLLVMPLASIVLSIGTHSAFQITFSPWQWPPLLLLAAWAYRRWGQRGERRLILALSITAALLLPWYVSHLDSIQQHYQGSSTGEHLTWASAFKLMVFEGLVLTFRNATPLGMLLICSALPFVFLRPKRLTSLALISLLTAMMCYPLYFHARYMYPVLPFACVLAAGAIIHWGRIATPIAFIFILLSGVRAAGWLLPISLPHYSMPFLASEMVDWHHEPWPGWWQLKAAGNTFAQRHLYTIHPPTAPSYPLFIMNEIQKNCVQQPCSWWPTDSERGFESSNQMEGMEAIQYHQQMLYQDTFVNISYNPLADGQTYAFYIYHYPNTLARFLHNQKDMRPRVIGHYVQVAEQNAALVLFGGPGDSATNLP